MLLTIGVDNKSKRTKKNVDNYDHNILRLLDVPPNVLFTTNDARLLVTNMIYASSCLTRC